MKKFYAGIAATAIAATGLVCSAGAAHADSAAWPSPYSIDPQGASVSLTLSADGASAYAAWVDGTDDTTIDVATTTLATGATDPVQQVTTSEGIIADAAATSTGKLVAVGHPDSAAGPDLLYGNVGSSTLTATPISGLDQVDHLAVSPNGDWAAVTGTNDSLATVVTLVDMSSGTPTLSSQAALSDSPADIQDIKVTDSGSAWTVGDDSAGNWLWQMGGGTVTATSLDAMPESVAPLGDGTVAVGLEGSDDQNEIVYLAHELSAPVDIDGPVGNLTVSGQTLWASGDGDSVLTRIDGTAAQTLTTTSYGQISDAAASADGATLYVVGAAWLADQDTNGPTSLFAMTAPAAPTTLDTWSAGDNITVSWTAADGTAGDDYRVTLTDQAAPHDVVSTTQLSDNVWEDGSASVDVSGVDPTHHYDVTVETFNGAFYSTPLTGQYLPTVPGQGTVTVAGAATVGTTLSGHLTSTWPSSATVDYQWLVSYSDGESGGLKAIPGATGTTLTLTPDLVGKYVALNVTAHLDTYTDAYAESDPLGPVAAAQATTPPATQPVQVTQIKPATIKASAKKVKLTLPGVSAASAPGKVKVYDGKKLIGTAKIVNGKLVVKLKKHLSHGQHKLKLSYKGSAQVAKFNKKVKIKVK